MKQTNRQRHYFLLCFILLFTVINTANAYHIYHLKQDYMQLSYQAEAMYQRSFGELTDAVQTMHEQLAQLLVTSSQEQLLYGLSGLWREVYSAISSLGSLPIAMHQLEQTDLLLHDTAEYSYYLMRKNVLNRQPLSLQDWNQLENFYQRSGVVLEELNKLETSLLSENFRLAMLSVEDEENPVASAFYSIENQVAAFPEIVLEEGVRKIEPEPQPIQLPDVSEAEALSRANAFLSAIEQTQNTETLQGSIAFVADNTKLPVYGIAYPNNRYVEVSRAGGLVLQYYCTQEFGNASLSISQAELLAQEILQRLHIPDMVCVEAKKEDCTASFVFVPQQDNVYLYPDMIKLQLSLDDGTLLSFDQTSYQTRHHKRLLSVPQLHPEVMMENRNPNFSVSSINLALIPDLYSNQEHLAYELRGSILNQSFAIFSDAHTGQELRIVRL